MQSDTTLCYDINIVRTQEARVTNINTSNTCGLAFMPGTTTIHTSMPSSCNGCKCEEIIRTSTIKRANRSYCRVGDKVTYQITFTNHSSIHIDTVRISNTVPINAVLDVDSITPPPQSKESLSTGIMLYNIASKHSVSLSYQITITANTPKTLQDYASTHFSFKDCDGCCHYGIGRSCLYTVQIVPKSNCCCPQYCSDNTTLYRSARCKYICNCCHN